MTITVKSDIEQSVISDEIVHIQEGEPVSGFILNSTDIRRLLSQVPLAGFFTEVADEIDKTYRDPDLRSEIRVGWPTEKLDTLEMMGCATPGSYCLKVIGSQPSTASRLSQVVEGTLTFNEELKGRRIQLHCDATALTPLRTAAGTAAVLRMVKPSFETIGVVGAGLEGTSHSVMLATMFPSVRSILLTDEDIDRARRGATRTKRLLDRIEGVNSRDIDIKYSDASDLSDIYTRDVIVTATYGAPAYGASPVIDVSDKHQIQPGTVIAAVGADLPKKRELGEGIYRVGRFLADDLRQCLKEGELQHAFRTLNVSDSEIEQLKDHRGVLLNGRVLSVANLMQRKSQFLNRDEPIIVYDSTGFSGQDLAVARVLRRHLEGMSWPKSVWNPPGEADLFDLMVEPIIR